MDGLELTQGRPKVLVLGASGFLGRNLLFLGNQAALFEWIAVSRTAMRGQPSWIDFRQWQKEADTIHAQGSRLSVVNCSAITDLDFCQKNPLEAARVNVGMAVEAAQFCKTRGIAMVQISSDGLFGPIEGDKSPHYWTEAFQPQTEYAKSKLAAEKELSRLEWGHCIRCSFVGPGLGTTRGLITFLAQKTLKSEKITGYSDVWFTPLHVVHIQSQIEALLLSPNFTNFKVHQWGCYPAITKAEFLAQVLTLAGMADTVDRVNRADLPGGDWAVLDQSMKSEVAVPLSDVLEKSVQSFQEEITALQAVRLKA